MPKTSTKFTAQFTTKIGKTPVEIKIPLNFADAEPGQSYDDYLLKVQEEASNQLLAAVETAKIKFTNQGDLKKAHKAYAKASAAQQSA